MKLNDLVGQKFGKLTVVRRDKNSGKQTMWGCECECGEQVSVGAHRLKNGQTKSCGCLRFEILSKRAKDITGVRFGRLVAISRSGIVNKKSKWKCMCDCGKETTVNYQHLKDGQVVSCGCYLKEVSANNGKIGGKKISGNKCHLYKPSLTDEDRLRTRNLVATRQWRKEVFAHDNFTCDVCGERGKKIQAHHLNNWADHKEQRFIVKNGITLCKKHHKDFHLLIGIRNKCTKADYERFKMAWQSKTPDRTGGKGDRVKVKKQHQIELVEKGDKSER